MSYQTIIEQYRTSLQTAYRQALDADMLLDELQKKGQGKFAAIFRADAGFTCDANRFVPYVQELGEQLQAFEAEPDPALLATLVKQLELVLSTLNQLRQSIK
ncbi:prephenate dehydrogenase [Ferrimonas pelagia]|uniref:Prephenate dehydrogenase n=1 Tax=Ferrimonas pelagia TaxID=1177826 RepID=A0ABP9EAI9_9GAMM